MYINLHDTLLDHRKARRAAAALDVAPVVFRGHIVTLWLNVLRHAPDGDLVDWNADDIAVYSEWTGDADRWVDVLRTCGWLVDGPEGSLVINDWDQYAEHLKARDRKAKEREKKRRQREKQRAGPGDVPGTGGDREGTGGDAAGTSRDVPPDQNGTDRTGTEHDLTGTTGTEQDGPGTEPPGAGAHASALAGSGPGDPMDAVAVGLRELNQRLRGESVSRL